jgi:predicted HNH restriction endonuclease
MPLLRNFTVKLKTKLSTSSQPSSQPSSPSSFQVIGRENREREREWKRQSQTTTPVQQKRMDSFLSESSVDESETSVSAQVEKSERGERRKSKFREELDDMHAEVSIMSSSVCDKTSIDE